MKRKRHAEHGNSERWLVSYADLVTLLFALFVVLYAESKADVDKLKKVQQSMMEAFEGAPPAPSAAPAAPATPGASTAPGPAGGPAATGLPGAPPDHALNQARDAIQESLKLEAGVADLNDKVQFSEDDRGLIVRLAAQDFFDDGIVEARPELRPLLDRIAKVLVGVPNSIRVEGHTDVEEESLSHSSLSGSAGGWELSAERATWVVKYWIKRWGMDPGRLSAAGLSHFHPLTQRKDDYSRGKNRRVEIIILRNPK